MTERPPIKFNRIPIPPPKTKEEAEARRMVADLVLCGQTITPEGDIIYASEVAAVFEDSIFEDEDETP